MFVSGGKEVSSCDNRIGGTDMRGLLSFSFRGLEEMIERRGGWKVRVTDVFRTDKDRGVDTFSVVVEGDDIGGVGEGAELPKYLCY